MRDEKPGGRDKQKKRRITLMLPVDALAQAELIARARNVNLSTVVSEALCESLRLNTTVGRGEMV